VCARACVDLHACQAQNLKSRSTTSPQSVPNVTPPVLSFSPDVLPEYYQEDNANPPSARASESRFSPGSSSDSDPGLNATPARRIGLHEQSANTGVDAHDKSAELPAQSETERRQIQPQAPITTFSRRRVIESDSDTSPIVRPVPVCVRAKSYPLSPPILPHNPTTNPGSHRHQCCDHCVCVGS